jgi:Flp pilus assembly pilin Flp
MVYILNNPPSGQTHATGMWFRRRPSAGSCPGIVAIRNSIVSSGGPNMHYLYRLWREDEGQDIAEYAVMLAVILVIVVGTIRLIGSNANNVFSNVASSIQ